MSYKPNFIKQYCGYAVGAIAVGLMTMFTVTSLPFESPVKVTMEYPCGTTLSKADNARAYDFFPNFSITTEEFDTIADIARRYELAARLRKDDMVRFFNWSRDDESIRTIIIPQRRVGKN